MSDDDSALHGDFWPRLKYLLLQTDTYPIPQPLPQVTGEGERILAILSENALGNWSQVQSFEQLGGIFKGYAGDDSKITQPLI